jgi:hypothetical protein
LTTRRFTPISYRAGVMILVMILLEVSGQMGCCQSSPGWPARAGRSPLIVTAAAEAPLKLGKFVYLQTLVEVTSLPWRRLASVEEVLRSYHLAGSFRMDTIIADPTGQLRRLHTQVSHHFGCLTISPSRCGSADDARTPGRESRTGYAPSTPPQHGTTR